jgi:hypothetical protein
MALRTADGRDVSEDEWRRIPGFNKYLINASGDIIGPSGWLLKETYNKTADTYAYGLCRDDGRRTSRSFKSLMKDAWPELEVETRPKVEPHTRAIRKGEWRTIPTFPLHEIHESGEIRYKKSRKRVYPTIDVLTGTRYYRLTNEWGQNSWSREWLMGRAFPDKDQELKDAA